MDDNEISRLFELADLIFAVGRQIRPPQDHAAEMCTPVESAVMRFIDRHPGTSARAAAEATLLRSSNFSRVLRGLEDKGLVRRDLDPLDARCVRLYPTAQAHENLQRLRQAWSQTLAGIVDEPETIDLVNTTLRRIENALAARRPSGDTNDRS
ncbi:MarR family transcriptional regulator [Frankia sp. CcI49]|uniref:MarR family winged helix-turn-helix transcriptional regulator n=1 Tax=Frankia sp. CcI49 TaxID=1745382 RepID=UPI0009779A9B|nr:MarR family transcriptional regulator [Frankia sp. CcI49]ONH51329.1 MarR family transcriptional regulator [Frankia sp. CcI49]